MRSIMQAALQSATAYDCFLSSGIRVGTNMGLEKLDFHQNDNKHFSTLLYWTYIKLWKVGTEPSTYMKPIHNKPLPTPPWQRESAACGGSLSCWLSFNGIANSSSSSWTVVKDDNVPKSAFHHRKGNSKYFTILGHEIFDTFFMEF